MPTQLPQGIRQLRILKYRRHQTKCSFFIYVNFYLNFPKIKIIRAREFDRSIRSLGLIYDEKKRNIATRWRAAMLVFYDLFGRDAWLYRISRASERGSEAN